MNNQCLYKLCVLGAILSFLPFFSVIPCIVRICGCQLGGVMQLGKGFEAEAVRFIRG